METLKQALVILRRKQVEQRTGLARATIYELIARDAFPKQIKLGGRASGWIESEVDAWIQSRVAESRAA